MTKKKVVLAYSGGLDTSFCAKYLSVEKQLEVHAVSVDTGGFSLDELGSIKSKALNLGAKTYTNINAVETYYQKVVRFLIYGNVLKNNTYPLSVSAERIVQGIEIVKYAKEIGASYIAHGSTGAGNDQVRFDMIFQTLAPEIEILTPIRDLKLSRSEEIAYLQSHDIDLSWSKAQYSINKGLWGTSIGGTETLSSHLPLPEKSYPSQLEKTEPEQLKLSFEKGQLVAINYIRSNAVSNIQELNKIASKYAIGRDTHVGDTIIGIKGRVGFEAAAPILIIKAHHLLEKHVLSKWQQQHKEYLSSCYGNLLHEGHYLDPVMRNIEAFLSDSQEKVTGDVMLKLHPYRFTIEGISSVNDLMNTKVATYGETNSGWTSEEAKGFIKILSNQGKIYNQTHKMT